MSTPSARCACGETVTVRLRYTYLSYLFSLGTLYLRGIRDGSPALCLALLLIVEPTPLLRLFTGFRP